MLLLRRVVFRRSLFRRCLRIGCCGRGGRRRCHCAFGIEQVVVAGAEAEFDQGAGIGSCFRLPALGSLVALHGGLRGAIPGTGGFAIEIVLSNQGFLNFAGARRINYLLAALPCDLLRSLFAVGFPGRAGGGFEAGRFAGCVGGGGVLGCGVRLRRRRTGRCGGFGRRGRGCGGCRGQSEAEREGENNEAPTSS